MRKTLVISLVSCLLLAAVNGVAFAGDTHAVSNRWAGVAIGATAAIAGGMLLNALQTPPWATAPTGYAQPPVAYSPPSVIYSPPPVIYTPPPVVYRTYAPPRVIYVPAPVVVHRAWGPPGHWNQAYQENARGREHR